MEYYLTRVHVFCMFLQIELVAKALGLSDLPENLLPHFSSVIAQMAESLLLDCAEPLIEIILRKRVSFIKLI